MPTKFLVTGATGTNGLEIVKQLLQLGHKPRVLVRNPSRAKELKNLNVEMVQGDFEDLKSLNAALMGIEKAFLVTSVDQNHRQWIENFIHAAKEAQLPHVIKLSGMGASLNSTSVIIKMHGQTDELIKTSGLNYTILRPNSFYQNMLWMARLIKQQGTFYLPMGEAKQSFVDVRDVASVVVKIFTESGHDKQIYDLTGPEALSYHEVAERLTKILGRPISYVNVTPLQTKQGMIEAGVPAWNALALAEIYTVFASGKYAYLTDTIQKILGRTPLSFDQFLKDHVNVFK